MAENVNLYEMMIRVADAMIAAEPKLTEFDSALGDGDCGQGMKTGFTQVKKNLEGMEKAGAQDILKKTAMAMISAVGGTSGAIYGTFFMRAAGALNDPWKDENTAICQALERGLAGAKERGEGTVVGDKTLIDALEPAIFTFKEKVLGGVGLKEACDAAAVAAEKGSDSTVDLIARKGRASYLGERSIGHRDAGSWGIVVIARTIAEYLG